MPVKQNRQIEQVNIDEIERDLPGYLRRVKAGATLIIVEAGQRLAELKPPSLRPYGLAAGEFTVPDDFDGPLPESTLREFEGA